MTSLFSLSPSDSMATSIESEGVGLSNPQLSLSRRRNLDLINRLHSTGVQVDIDLPQITLAGIQSSGKSSLIESISGITLPRASGTCTRCPTECRLSRSEEAWKCQVFLRHIIDATGVALAQVKNERFGDVIYDKALVEERIRRAQRAILNPSRPASDFLYDEDEDVASPELTFTSNYISLKISGPDVADLSFCDLPGLISSSSGDGSDITRVLSVVSSYISKPSCVILLTVACETDFQNQGAYQLAKEKDPEGKRTIGVLTKPDRIPKGDEDRWLALIRNEDQPLKNNWYCVKQPGSTALKNGISWKQARDEENEFFLTDHHFSKLDPIYQKYLRTGNLVERLSGILSDLIAKRLPQIKLEIDASILKVQQSLQRLPSAPTSEPLNDISGLLSSFCRDIAKHIEGIAESDGLLQRIRPLQENFRKSILGTAPPFSLHERSKSVTKIITPEFIIFEDGESDTADLKDFSWDGEKTDRPSPIFVDDVFRRAQESRTRELPGNYPYTVEETYIREFTGQWGEPAMHFSAEVHALLVADFERLIKQHFRTFGQGVLEQRVRVLVEERLAECLSATRQHILLLLDVEKHPFTLNTHYLSYYKEKYLTFYRSSRQNGAYGDALERIRLYKQPLASRKGCFSVATGASESINNIIAGLAELGIPGVKPGDLAKLLPTDPMEAALDIMSEVGAYFRVAYKRFSDNVPLAVDNSLVRGFGQDLLKVLTTGLRIYGPDGEEVCREMAQENIETAQRRSELLKRLERLKIARMELLQTMI